MVPGAVGCDIWIKVPCLFVPSLSMLSIEEAKGRSRRVQTFEYSGEISRDLVYPSKVWVDWVRPRIFFPNSG